ncbi:uncharacterized protein LOC117639346 isoform X2 [Thrips palmi]|uniref:Uncharacterized protein LOC117639346 isoform X2 n=1 Tax=Thrips palmi TaxID=161013 RepID=A0A6P8ZGW4_THRPL|nr:uncharacterized protein LOC117639346 isoform X2 [Thrips palmi]
MTAATALVLGVFAAVVLQVVGQTLPANMPQMFIPAGQQTVQQTTGQGGTLLPVQSPNFLTQLGFSPQSSFATGSCIICGVIFPGVLVVNNASSTLLPVTATTPAVVTTTAAATTTTTTARPVTVVVQIQQQAPSISYVNGYQLLRLKLAQKAYTVGNVLAG